MEILFPQFSETLSCQFLGRDDDRTVPEHCVRLNQVHGNRTVICREPSHATEQADGVLSDVHGLPLIVRASDCQNFALYAPEKNVIGVLHAGWRGIISGAIEGFFEALHSEWGISPEQTFVVAGPSLCTACAEFSDPEHELPGVDPQFFHDRNVDLQGIANTQLFDLGLPPEHLNRHPDCTRCKNQQYLSYRGGDKQAVKDGLSNFLVCSLS